jgi:hypothetical protein
VLGWDREIKWLFSPVVGKERFPGDIWGIDSNGNLILVETKLAKAHRPGQNPFVDFIHFETRRAKRLSTELILGRWEDLFKDEIKFIERHRKDVEEAQRKEGTFPGVVPYSRHRRAVWEWRHVYLGVLAPQFHDGERYADKVRRYLAKRSNNSPIHYFGIVAVVFGSTPRLSPTGQAEYDALCRMAGTARTHFRGLQASYTKDQQVEVTALG